MGGFLEYDVAAIAVLIVIAASLIFTNKFELQVRKIFLAFLGNVIVATFLEIITFKIKYGEITAGALLKEVTSGTYFFSLLMIAILYANLNVELYYIYYQIRFKVNAIFLIPLMVALGLLFSNPFLRLVFHYDENGNYMRGKGFYIFACCALFYFLFSAMYQYRYRVALPRNFKMILAGVYTVIGLVVLTEILKIKTISIFSAVTLGILMVFLHLSDVDEFFCRQTSLLNKRSMKKMLYIRTKEKEPFEMYVMKVGGFSCLKDIYEEEYTDKIIMQVGHFIEETFKNCRCFQVGEHTFTAFVTKESKVTESEIIAAFEERFARFWEHQAVVIDLCCKIGKVSCPKDADTFKAILQYIECVEKEEHFHKDLEVLEYGDVDFEKHNREKMVENAIARALKHNGFRVFYQPIYSTSQKKIISAEALIRLYDKELGNISPEEFIPIAEKNGSILKIGLYVFDTVCRYIVENDLEKHGIEYVEINLSVVQCMQSKLAEQLVKIMKQYHVRSEQINLEITETAAADIPEKLKQNMNNLSKEGILFSLDDYGNGYSNISSVINLPLSFIKLDKGIVWSAFENERAYTAMASSIEMFKKLDLKVIAEGIETIEQSEKLSELGCDYLQGFYYSKPLPEQEFLQYLDSKNNAA